MQAEKTNTFAHYILPGILISVAFTTVIGLTAANLSGFQIVGQTGIAFHYPWQLTEPNSAARLTAWSGYLLHNLIVWAIIYFAQREKLKFGNRLRWFNWAMIATHLVFVVLHIFQSQLFYDGLAQDVPEVTAQGSVAVMLMIIIIFETPRRGLIFGKKFKFKDGFVEIVRKYHGYFFAWATIYTFWYHPTEGTWGHLMGFLYMFMLFVQSALIFNRAHLNRWWTVSLEVFVVVHGTVVAVLQGNGLWSMFAFGFGAMIVLTQMYGLGLNTWTKRGLAVGFIVLVVAYYALSGDIAGINEVIRIPVIDYLVIFLLYGVYLLVSSIINVFSRRAQMQADMD
ncbi:MAG TPA: hypothetical protein VK249_12955 [Anaerolineales bacterium]|nr:hypothetical protein [Anaerolineales bacterium]